jgi:DNA-binding LytR/AlgR family response regulator
VQQPVRKAPDDVREAQQSAVGASRNAAYGGRGLREWVRNLLIAAAAGVFLALVGALGTNELPFVIRLGYWVPLIVGGALVAEVVALGVNRVPRAGASPWLYGALLAFFVSIPISVLVWLYTALIFERALVVAHLPYQFGPVLVISAAMTALMLLVSRPGRVTHAAAGDAEPGPIRFLDRLPAKLKGAVIYAVSSEDHYLRLHTSKGSDLILMRLTDAITELEGLEGAQTHRSWWVARDAVESARRDGDNVKLMLKGGVEAPVSRPNVRALREEGWL